MFGGPWMGRLKDRPFDTDKGPDIPGEELSIIDRRAVIDDKLGIETARKQKAERMFKFLIYRSL
jgi:hypothetical protein